MLSPLSQPTLCYQHHPGPQDILHFSSQIQFNLVSPVLAAAVHWESRPHLGLVFGNFPQQQHPSPLSAVAPISLGVALLTVAGEDVAVGGSEPHAP